ncbi:GNAT family N-acetyltransferase [Cellulomonas endophytica]|uniref:GNAT family N-acetyltransferase n=1 Tax=Cellulomonas endophytica TaxID=2494735 RepID=UPI001011E31C|nr:GNAT family N-acetyltransferase [Cellulomonas endophytica]
MTTPSPSPPGSAAPDLGAVRVEELHTAEDLDAASRLYRTVFGYTGPEAGLNRRLLRALAVNGGATLGARVPGGPLLAFAYGFPGLSAGVPYFYSQAAVVAAGAQGLGLGRRLKAAQADAARGRGFTTMRWSFDPLYARNAHVNLDVLGAVGRWFHRDLYGDGDSDRLVVEWTLATADEPDGPGGAGAVRPGPWRTYGPQDWGRPDPHPDRPDALVALPLPAGVQVGAGDRAAAADVAARLGHALDALLAAGLPAVRCVRQDATTAVYVCAATP